MRKLFLFAIFAAFIAMTSLLPALDAPKWIGAFPVQKRVGLKWQPVEGAEAYVIYRAAAGQPAAKLTEVSQTQYFDETVEAGESYQYTITAVAAGAEGAASDARSVTMPGVKKGEMKGPVWVGIREDGGRTFLNWDPQPGAEVVAYNVHRSEVSGGPYEIIASTQQSKYIDADVKDGKTYYYVITALDASFSESPKSEERSFSRTPVAASAEAASSPEIKQFPAVFQFEIVEGGGKKLNSPSDVAVAPNGDICVVDVRNHRVAIFDAQGNFKAEAGMESPQGKGGANAPDGALEMPFKATVDANNHLYVTDLVIGDIQSFDLSGNFLRRIKTSQIEGEKPFRPTGVHVFPDGRMLVSDRDNHRLLMLDADGRVTRSVGKRGNADGDFNFPNDIAVDSKGNIQVLDVINARVEVFDSEGKFLTAFGSLGTTAGTFARPKGMCVDSQDRTWVADGMSNAIQVFGPQHTVISYMGGFENKDLWMNNPMGMAVSGGRLFVADSRNNRVLVFKIG